MFKLYSLMDHMYEGETFPGSCGLQGDPGGFAAIEAYIKLWKTFRFWMRMSIGLGVLSLILLIAAIYGLVR